MRTELVKEHSEKSVTMEYFLETTHLDKETAAMLLKYDKDGNGRFSKDEVVSIILDLKDTQRTNESLDASKKLFKRLFIGAAVLCVLLLSGMFGLSYAVAVLTANTEVKSDGTLMSKDGTAFIATDSTANVYEMHKTDGNYCMTDEEAAVIREQALSGRNVLVQFNEFEGNHAFVEQLSASGADIDDESQRVCFKAPELGEDKYLCMMPSESCPTTYSTDSHGRRLKHKGNEWEITPN
jgi:hypothetical protein